MLPVKVRISKLYQSRILCQINNEVDSKSGVTSLPYLDGVPDKIQNIDRNDMSGEV